MKEPQPVVLIPGASVGTFALGVRLPNGGLHVIPLPLGMARALGVALLEMVGASSYAKLCMGDASEPDAPTPKLVSGMN